jgi:hypothetical protein
MGPRCKFGLILKQIESLSWTLPWTLASILVLQIMSSLFLALFLLGFQTNGFSFQNRCLVDLASICHFFALGGPHLKAMGPIYGSHPIGLLYFIGPGTLNPHLKWPFISNHPLAYRILPLFTSLKFVESHSRVGEN